MIGKFAALMTAAALGLALAVSVALSFTLAAIRGIPTSNWLGAAGAQTIGRTYGNTLLSLALFAILGTALALIVRSTVPAVALGVAWMMPLEHIVQGVWADAGGWFPGLVLDAITRSGTTVAPYSRSLHLGLLYTGVLAVVGAISFLRRDVTT